MKASNQKWIVWRRHRDDLSGTIRCNGPPHKAIEVLQRSWSGKTGVTWKVCYGGLVDALIESTRI